MPRNFSTFQFPQTWKGEKREREGEGEREKVGNKGLRLSNPRFMGFSPFPSFLSQKPFFSLGRARFVLPEMLSLFSLTLSSVLTDYKGRNLNPSANSSLFFLPRFKWSLFSLLLSTKGDMAINLARTERKKEQRQ